MKQFLKQIYNLIPLKKETYSVLKTVWRPRESIYKHLHFKGIIDVKINDSRSFKLKHYGYQVENSIFWEGLTNGWEKESIKLWLKLCEESDIVFDIGANTGVYSLIAKTINPQAKVYAFEPVKRVYAKLKENVVLNNFDIIPIEKAVSNADGVATIFDTSAEHTYSVTVNKNLNSPQTRVVETKITTTTLNSFIKSNNIGKIDLLKIDVETHEAEVLEGFSEYLQVFKPTMLIEILDDVVGQQVFNLVKGIDYLYFNIDENSGIRQVDKITKSDFYNYLICTPQIAGKLGILN